MSNEEKAFLVYMSFSLNEFDSFFLEKYKFRLNNKL